MNNAKTKQSGGIYIKSDKFYTQNEVDNLQKNWEDNHYRTTQLTEEKRATSSKKN